MAAFSYTALRNVMSGHSANSSYSFDIGCSAYNRKRKATRYTSRSLGGVSETYLSLLDQNFSITTIAVLENSNLHKQLVEFLSSVIGGESFMFDRYGTVAVPVGATQFEMVSDGFDENREGVSDYVSFTFEIRSRITP